MNIVAATNGAIAVSYSNPDRIFKITVEQDEPDHRVAKVRLTAAQVSELIDTLWRLLRRQAVTS